jgi:K(+)-stimulated pyrophosphate-energized sodium pump
VAAVKKGRFRWTSTTRSPAADHRQSEAAHRHADRRVGAVPVQLHADPRRRPRAYLIVNECRIQFRDPEIWKGTKKPDYGRVVGICTTAAQKNSSARRSWACSRRSSSATSSARSAWPGFLGGAIVAGQLLASFMCNAGGAWDNAKKMVEDEPRTAETGKGSEKHKASVTGDTVGDPLKDTAGPPINPLLKVMNMVAVLGVPLMLAYDSAV